MTCWPPLRRGWRKRVLVKKADDDAPSLPAVVGMLRVLRRPAPVQRQGKVVSLPLAARASVSAERS